MTPRSELVEVVRAGRPILVPTDTVYGIGVLPTDPVAVQEIFKLKGRPADKPLPVLAADVAALRDVAVFSESAVELARCFWPGALTLVLPRAGGFTHDLGGTDEGSIAVRVPNSQPLRELLEVTGPLAVTSANLSGQQPATTLEEALAIFGEDTPALDGDETAIGEASTVLSLLGAPEILRGGAVSLSAIHDCLRAANLDT